MQAATPIDEAFALLSLFQAAEELSDSTQRSRPYETALALMNRSLETVHFVQVGANDGQTGDVIRQFVMQSKWTGIMVEPHPEAFAALESLYKDDNERLKLVNKAITLSPGEVELLEPETRFGSRTSTILPDSGYARSCKIKRSFRTEGIPLASLLEECNMRRVDVLQIDVEGYDFEVLMSLDFSVTRPILISYEDRHFFPPKKRTEAVRYLRQRGYKVLTGLPPDDTLALDEAAFRVIFDSGRSR